MVTHIASLKKLVQNELLSPGVPSLLYNERQYQLPGRRQRWCEWVEEGLRGWGGSPCHEYTKEYQRTVELSSEYPHLRGFSGQMNQKRKCSTSCDPCGEAADVTSLSISEKGLKKKKPSQDGGPEEDD